MSKSKINLSKQFVEVTFLEYQHLRGANIGLFIFIFKLQKLFTKYLLISSLIILGLVQILQIKVEIISIFVGLSLLFIFFLVAFIELLDFRIDFVSKNIKNKNELTNINLSAYLFIEIQDDDKFYVKKTVHNFLKWYAQRGVTSVSLEFCGNEWLVREVLFKNGDKYVTTLHHIDKAKKL